MKWFFLIVILLLVGLGIFWLLFRDRPGDIDTYERYVQELSTFETSRGQMSYLDRGGEGKAIILLHGVPTSSWMYRKLTGELVVRDYRVIAPDLMGFGNSAAMSDMDDYDFATQAELIFELMDYLELEESELLVHDMGGVVAWNMVEQQPERISHLTLLNTILYKDTFNPPGTFNEGNAFHRWLLSLHAHPYIGKMIVDHMIRQGTSQTQLPTEQRAGYWHPIRDDGAMALVHFFTHTDDIKPRLTSYRENVQQSGIPLTVIWGEDDPFLDAVAATRVQREFDLPDEVVHVIPNVSHLIAEEIPEGIAEIMSAQ